MESYDVLRRFHEVVQRILFWKKAGGAMNEIKIKGVKIQYDKNNVRIIDSHKVKEKDMKDILFWFLFKTGYESKRDIDSWLREWKTHNRIYKLRLLRKHTADCDLEENERCWRLLFYEILAAF